MKLLRALVGMVVFLISLLIIYYIHVNFFRVNVVFYAAITDGVLASIIAGVLLIFFKYFQPLNGFEKFQLIIIWLITGYALAISVPTVIDRSLSFYILEKIQQRGGGIRQDKFEQVFTQEYMKEHHLVDVRLTEQLESGTIEIDNGCVLLTPKGRRIASFSRFFRKNWLPKHRLLMGQYSDVLTDPFKSSTNSYSYSCK
jgi:hypothetical protein